MTKIFKVGLIGCGHIAETYFRAHKYFNNFKIIKCADINNSASKKCASIYNIEHLTVNNLLKDIFSFIPRIKFSATVSDSNKLKC